MADLSKSLTPSELSDLKAKAKAATPGPWEADGQGNRMDGGYGPYEDAAVLFRRNGHMTTGVLVETSNADHLLTPKERRANCDHILSGDMKREIENAAIAMVADEYSDAFGDEAVIAFIRALITPAKTADTEG